MDSYYTRHDRMSRKQERQIYRRIAITVVLSIVLLFLIFNWGIRALVAVADFWDLIRTGRETQATAVLPPFPPRLEPVASATNSATLVVRGFAAPGSSVELFLNGQSLGKKLVTNDNTFTFDDVILENGENQISALATDQAGNGSQPSGSLAITYKNKAPKLVINTPNDGQHFSGSGQQELKIFGKAEGANQVTINGFWATLVPDGTFTYNLRLNQGENKVTVVASDDAGNKTTNERTVFYAP